MNATIAKTSANLNVISRRTALARIGLNGVFKGDDFVKIVYSSL